jgi:tRNA A-37 threonylcarbamoyl transferase component Bud32
MANDRVMEEMTHGLSQRLAAVLGVQAPCLLRGPVLRQQNSQIFYAECAGQPFPLMIKQCTMPNTQVSDTRSARTQFDALQRAWAMTAGERRYNVPTPVALLEAEGIVVMEWIEGDDMTSRLTGWGVSLSERRQLVEEAAEWLRRFHHAGDLAPVRLAARKLLPRLTADPSPILADRFYRAGVAMLDRTRDVVEASEVTGGLLHGDFKSDNLLVCRNRITAIDLHLEDRDTLLFDISMFLNHLELLGLHPRGLRLATKTRELAQAFLDRYFGATGGTAPLLPLAWVRLFVLLGAWVDLPDENPGRARYHYMSFCYRRVARHLTRGLSALAGYNLI